VTFALNNHSGSYKLVLTEIPQGYQARKDSYTYRSDSGAIVLDIVSVIYPDDHSKAAYKVGSTMGDFTVTDVDDKTYQLSQLLQEKKLVILNFWYYTCVPCKAEFPYFNSIYQRYGDKIEILALNHFDSESKIRQLRSEMGLTFPLATEQLGMQQGFNIQSYPVSVFIGGDGRILYIQKDVGFETEAELDNLVRQMLGR
jgi:peroxiredoxin